MLGAVGTFLTTSVRLFAQAVLSFFVRETVEISVMAEVEGLGCCQGHPCHGSGRALDKGEDEGAVDDGSLSRWWTALPSFL